VVGRLGVARHVALLLGSRTVGITRGLRVELRDLHLDLERLADVRSRSMKVAAPVLLIPMA
jgi:deoxyinosine 3'endonuclease (endonuclease V)